MVIRIATLLCVSTAFAVGSLTSSATIQETGFCPAVSQTGTSSVSVTQTCSHPAGFTFETGTAAASASNGAIEATTSFGGFISYPRGEASASFLTPMQIVSSEAGPLFLTFRVHYTGSLSHHAESTAQASSTWTIDGATLGSFFGPCCNSTENVDTFADYAAAGMFAAGDTFLLGGAVNTAAQDYHGYSQLSAELVGIEVRNASGDLVAADVTFIPEPATAGIALAGLLVIGARKYFIVRD